MCSFGFSQAPSAQRVSEGRTNPRRCAYHHHHVLNTRMTLASCIRFQCGLSIGAPLGPSPWPEAFTCVRGVLLVCRLWGKSSRRETREVRKTDASAKKKATVLKPEQKIKSRYRENERSYSHTTPRTRALAKRQGRRRGARAYLHCAARTLRGRPALYSQTHWTRTRTPPLSLARGKQQHGPPLCAAAPPAASPPPPPPPLPP